MGLRHVTALALYSGVLVATVLSPANAQQSPADMAGKRPAEVTPQNFRWQRTITPPKGSPLAEACVVIDAATFANAAPALRDLRLYQDGAEVPYVIEQSFDDRALDTGVTPPDDRSLYEVSATGWMQPHSPEDKPGTAQIESASISLPPRVPVERIRFEPVPPTRESIGVRAAEAANAFAPGSSETAQGIVDAENPTFAFTVGANLQSAAEVTVLLAGVSKPKSRVLLEMRRRSLCYHPATSSPLVLYLGGGDIAAESYAFARAFQSETDRPYATMGPLLPNPDYHPQVAAKWHFTKAMRLETGLAAFALLFFLNTRRLLRKRASSQAR